MRDQDKPKFLAVLNELAAIKPNAKLTAVGLDLWWGAMRHWRIEEFVAAAEQLARTEQFFPNPWHFEQLREAQRSTVPEQWARAIDHARNLPVSGGFLQERPSGDALLDAAVRAIGGYRAIANAEQRDLHFLGQRFEEHYETTRDAEDTRLALPDLTGGPRLEVSGLVARKRLA